MDPKIEPFSISNIVKTDHLTLNSFLPIEELKKKKERKRKKEEENLTGRMQIRVLVMGRSDLCFVNIHFGD